MCLRDILTAPLYLVVIYLEVEEFWSSLVLFFKNESVLVQYGSSEDAGINKVYIKKRNGIISHLIGI